MELKGKNQTYSEDYLLRLCTTAMASILENAENLSKDDMYNISAPITALVDILNNAK